MDDVIALVQARARSSRLPGKVLLPLAGKPVLARVVERCAAAHTVRRVVVATTTAVDDDAVAAAAASAGAAVFRGDENDVLGRFAAAAEAFPAAHYVRVTADCPLLDPDVVDAVVSAHLAGGYDFSYNDVAVYYPRGYDVEVIAAPVIFWLAAHCRDAVSREHVTAYLYDHPDDFKIYQKTLAAAAGDFRLTLDVPADYELMAAIYERLGADPTFGLAATLALLESEPGLADLNRGVPQKSPPPTPSAK